ncbi:ABC transporter family protein [Sediminihabitans luteus]|uniref:ABC transporter family protein n=2 Tax=Sediminihabitans luteus TaxID=1138585 RepID=A0A2M9CZS8_9CELL|nr:ABC transporter family protein [Sediminihabitans luteus]
MERRGAHGPATDGRQSMAKEPTPLRARDLWAGHVGRDVVRGVDLELVPGAAPVGIAGESGSGKTTIVQALLGTIKPSRGNVSWGGQTVSRIGRVGATKKQFKAHVRAVRQYGIEGADGVDPHKSVEKAVARALADARKAGRSSSRSAVELLELVGLADRHLDRVMRTLSGGEKQRLALAFALATRPEVLLLDEPFTALDPNTRAEVVGRLRAIVESEGIALLVVSHDLELLERLCPTVHILADGVFVQSGPLRDVLAQPAHPAVKDLADAAPLAVQRWS